MSTTKQITVDNKAAFDQAVQHYVSRGFGPVQMTADTAVLVKQAQSASLGCAFWLALVIFFPIAIWMAINNSKRTSSETVTISLVTGSQGFLDAPPALEAAAPTELTMSEDGNYWWNGRDWTDANASSPPMAVRNPDGTLWWDGSQWRAVR